MRWTKSEAFRKAHARAGNNNKPTTLGHPEFEGFHVLQEVTSRMAPSSASRPSEFFTVSKG